MLEYKFCHILSAGIRPTKDLYCHGAARGEFTLIAMVTGSFNMWHKVLKKDTGTVCAKRFCQLLDIRIGKR